MTITDQAADNIHRDAVVRLKRAPGLRNEALAFVTLPGARTEVRVRFRRGNGPVQWRCDACGDHRFSTCPHEVAVRDSIRRSDRLPREVTP